MTEIYEFYGMRRSGIHAIIYWVLKNLTDMNAKKSYFDNYSFFNKDLYFHNDFRDEERSRSWMRTGLKGNPKKAVFVYEDQPTTFSAFNKKHTNKFVIIRNLENLVASRLKAQSYFIKGLAEIDLNFFNTWEQHAQVEENIIHYESWLTDKSYRDAIAQQFGVVNKDIIDYVPIEGGGSSFVRNKLDKVENLLTRYNQIQFPPNIQKLINEYGTRNSKYFSNRSLNNESNIFKNS